VSYVLIKLELNSYDYEDEYKYMLSIAKDSTTGTSPDNYDASNTAQTVLNLLRQNPRIDIAEETPTGLRIYKKP